MGYGIIISFYGTVFLYGGDTLNLTSSNNLNVTSLLRLNSSRSVSPQLGNVGLGSRARLVVEFAGGNPSRFNGTVSFYRYMNYCSANGHFYAYAGPASGTSWVAALRQSMTLRANASAAFADGLPAGGAPGWSGHLATVTTPEEKECVRAVLSALPSGRRSGWLAGNFACFVR
jgi:hypothetical protein